MAAAPCFRCLLLYLVLAGTAGFGVAGASAAGLSPQGEWLAGRLDGMDVIHRWIAGAHIDWETGLPDGRPETAPGRHTHCSAFVASAAEQLGIYILRPPQHGQVLLANAQNEWLASEGAAAGWRPVDGPLAAQDLANRGVFVVASYRSHYDERPGHIAIIRPSARPTDAILAEGPEVIQAGTVNSASTSLARGFAGHPAAWRDGEVAYWAHEVPASAQR